MDFTLDSEQTALRDAVRGLLKGYDAEHRREVTKNDPGFDEDMWSKLAEMGVLGLPFSEDDGGMGAGQVEVSVVAEEFGRVVAPEPFVEAVVLAGGIVAACGSDEQKKEILGGISSGEIIPAFAWADPTGGEKGVTVDGDTLTGVKEPVLNGGRADTIIVFAEGLLFLVDGAATERTSYRTFDGGRAARIRFDKTPATPLGDPGDATEATQSVIAAAQVAYAHEALGAMDSRAQADHVVPHDAQAVRRLAQPLPGAHLPRGRHVHLARADPQHRQLGHHGPGRRRRLAGEEARGGSPRQAPGEQGRTAHRPGGDPAPRRHRHDR